MTRASKPCRAVIAAVEDGSPAWEAGLEPGMVLTQVNDVPLTDMIEWQWQADGFDLEVTLDTGEVAYLERDLGQDWGITFTDCIFDGLRTCRNNCIFCFMRMLPPNMRGTLYLRDDDYRLSFMQGNFVTLTNLCQADYDRIVKRWLEPLHVSVHAIRDEVRRELMGKNAHKGKEWLVRLLDAGIQIHAQLVLCPGINDGEVLVETLEWLEQYPNVLSVGLVPLGYTKFQDRFSRSYSDEPARAEQVIATVYEFQERARSAGHTTRYHIADEFYLCSGVEFPPAEFYDGYPQFQDGIGMTRSFIDDWKAAYPRMRETAAARCADAPPVTIVTGTSFARVLQRLVAESPLAGHINVLPVKNEFFGGNTDVSGLLTASDVVPALKAVAPCGLVLLPRAAFNADMLMLDDATLDEVKAATGCAIHVCTYSVEDILEALQLPLCSNGRGTNELYSHQNI